MIPLGDDNSLRRTIPIMTYALIAINILVFLFELSGGEEFVMKWAFIPNRFLANPIENIPTIFTAMFMHASWGHLIGNMLYLWIFGDNVEDHLGKIQYLVFYLVCGVAAVFSQLLFHSATDLPNVGASGAIAGVLGAYILFWPKARIHVMLGFSSTEMPALIVIGFWFFIQFISGIGSLSSLEEGEGGVAYMAHIGGFLAGLGIAIIYRIFNRPEKI